jgi:hypothetical protein
MERDVVYSHTCNECKLAMAGDEHTHCTYVCVRQAVALATYLQAQVGMQLIPDVGGCRRKRTRCHHRTPDRRRRDKSCTSHSGIVITPAQRLVSKTGWPRTDTNITTGWGMTLWTPAPAVVSSLQRSRTCTRPGGGGRRRGTPARPWWRRTPQQPRMLQATPLQEAEFTSNGGRVGHGS